MSNRKVKKATKTKKRKAFKGSDAFEALTSACEHLGPFVFTDNAKLNKIFNKLYIQLRLCGMSEKEVKAVITTKWAEFTNKQ